MSPEWVLAIVGIITCGVIGWQSWETRRSAEAAKTIAISTLRPKLIIRGIALLPGKTLQKEKEICLGNLANLHNVIGTQLTIDLLSDDVSLSESLADVSSTLFSMLGDIPANRSEEHTLNSSHANISYAVF